MKKLKCMVTGLLVCIGLVTLLSACATTQINSAWKEPSYKGPPGKIMVIGIARKPVNRRIFEDEFVRQLKARGTDAFASYTVLSDKLENNQAFIAAKMKEQGADTLLISRLISKKIVKTYVPGTIPNMPGYYGRWPDYYGYGYETIYSPGYVAEDEYAYVETNLYGAKDDNLIWSAVSKTLIQGSDQQIIKSFIAVMLDTMVKQKVLQ